MSAPSIHTAALNLLRIRSERNKVAVPHDRSFISEQQNSAVAYALGSRWIVWLDRCPHPAFGWREIDVYLLTPEGLKIAEEAEAKA